MAKSDEPLMSPADIWLAAALLTRLRVPARQVDRRARAAWAYPLVGILTGGLAALIGMISLWLGLPPVIAALAALTCQIIATGAMHEDGLADTADGLWGGWDRDARLRIMKDSHIGTYGMLALLVSVLARWSALWLLFSAGTSIAVTALLAAGALSRAAMPVLMCALPHARDSGLSHHVGRAGAATACLAAGFGTLIALLLLGRGVFAPLFWVGLISLALGLVARRKIGGQTGDILGATQQVSEIAVLLSLVTVTGQ